MALPHKKKGLDNRFFLPTFGAHLPGVPNDVGSKLVFYPLPRFDVSGFDLDCTATLVSNGLILDTFFIDYLDAEKPPYLAPMRAMINELASHDLVTFVDFAACAADFKADLETWVDRLLQWPVPWLVDLREAVRVHQPAIERQIRHMGPFVDANRERRHYSVQVYEKLHGVEEGAARRLDGYLNSKRITGYSKGEQEEIRELVRPMLMQAAFNQKLSKYLGVPFLDWEDMDVFHRRLAGGGATMDGARKLSEGHLRATHEIFSTTLNAIVPTTPKQLMRFLRSDSSVRSLRAAVARSLATGTRLDERWVVEVCLSALRANLARQRRQQTFRWMGTAVGMAVPLGGIAVEGIHRAGGALGELASQLADKGIDQAGELTGRRRTDSHKWLYTLLEILEASD